MRAGETQFEAKCVFMNEIGASMAMRPERTIETCSDPHQFYLSEEERAEELIRWCCARRCDVFRELRRER